MKRALISIVCLIIIFVGCLLLFHKKDGNNLKKIKVAEVTHSVFYAPQYVADSLGYFKDEGLDVEIILTPGADKVASAVLSNSVDIGLCGSEQTIYIYNQGKKDYLVNISALTKKDGSFIISRNNIKNFKLDNLKDKHIIAGRQGGMPSMTLKYTLNSNNIKTTDLNFDTSIDFASMNGAFIGGTGDFVTAFEPSASSLVKQGYGYIVGSLGEFGGNVPYTTYNAKLSYYNKNKDTVIKFRKAIQKGLDYVHNNKSTDIASVISSYFPDVSYNDLVNSIDKYKSIDAWYNDTKINETDFKHIEEIIDNDHHIDFVPFNKLVFND